MIILDRPVIHPGVCIVCGTQESEYFVDPELQLDLHFNPLYSGAVIFCKGCWHNTVETANRLIQEREENELKRVGSSSKLESQTVESRISDTESGEPDNSTEGLVGVSAEVYSTVDASSPVKPRSSGFRFGRG